MFAVEVWKIRGDRFERKWLAITECAAARHARQQREVDAGDRYANVNGSAKQYVQEETTTSQLPLGLMSHGDAYRIIFVDTAGLDLRHPNPSTVKKVNEALFEALCAVCPETSDGQALVKVHVGEPKCATHMKPEYVQANIQLMRERGQGRVVAGDTTVAYSGPRGYKENRAVGAYGYLALAREHGWSGAGPARMPFVVLDCPSTAQAGVFSFTKEEEQLRVDGIHRFTDFYLAGGFAAADFVINNAHLTLHGLAGVAGCVKSITMGCSSLRGKLRMHQSLLPKIDPKLCKACGSCVESCPENALELHEGATRPTVNPDLCIGCGQCEAVCDARAITLRGEVITDWDRGKDTLPLRMADYAIGMMNGRWESTIHVLHMYSITERCDCLNVRQKAMVKQDLGFLVGRNPFAIDKLGSEMFAKACRDEGKDAEGTLLAAAETIAKYARVTYGIVSGALVERISVR